MPAHSLRSSRSWAEAAASCGSPNPSRLLWSKSGRCRCPPTSTPPQAARRLSNRVLARARLGCCSDGRIAFHASTAGYDHHPGHSYRAITLHVGLDTFAPVTEADPRDHAIHTEWCSLDAAAADAINAARTRGGRIVTVGTTSARTLETAARAGDGRPVSPFEGPTDVFILPGFAFRAVERADYQLPLAALDAAHAGQRIRRQGHGH